MTVKMTLRHHNIHGNVQTVEQWAKSCIQKLPFSVLKDTVIGVDASYYLDLRLNGKVNGKVNEALINALGGTPYALKSLIENDIEALKKHDIRLFFVFDGLDFVNKGRIGVQTIASMRAHEEAWQHYEGKDPDKSLSDFARAKYSVEVLYRYVQKLLAQNGVEFQVAPYSAVAQLSYLYKRPEQFIDVVMSSANSFLFDIDKIVLNFDPKSSTVEWLSKNTCQDLLDRSNDDLFRNSQLLLGSVFLPMFPPLERASNGKPTLRDALSLLVNAGRSVAQLCHQYRDDNQVQSLQYADRYKKAIMTIKHHVVMRIDGSVAPLDFEHAPGDVHEFVGQRLPEELFYYVSKGMLGPQIPNWLSSGEIILSLPGGVLDTLQYKALLVEKLNDLRAVTLKLLADSLNRYWHSRTVNFKVWFDRDTTSLAISMKYATAFKAKVAEWKVKEVDFPPALKSALSAVSQGEANSSATPTKYMLAALQALKDETFAQSTISKAGPEPSTILESFPEVVVNVFWRFLQMAGYIKDDHTLSPWGNTLEATLIALEAQDHEEELALVAVEMLRLGVFQIVEFDGNATPTSDIALKNIVTRVASIGRFKHEQMGFSGPLDRKLLSFAWMVHAVRTTLRDLVETNLVCMFLNGDAARDRDDLSQLAHFLPFVSDNGAGLGIAARTYLDEVSKVDEGIIDDETKRKIKKQEEPYEWFQFSVNYEESLEASFGLWDAVYAGSCVAGKDLKDGKILAEANKWLSKRR